MANKLIQVSGKKQKNKLVLVQNETSKKEDKTVLPTMAGGMVGAQGSSLKDEGVWPAITGALNEFTGGAIQNPRSFVTGGPTGANVAVGEDLIGMVSGKADKDVGLYVPQTLGGNVVQAGAGIAAGIGAAKIPEGIEGFIRGATSGTKRAIQATESMAKNLTGEIDNIKGFLASEANRVNRVEGTAQTFLKASHQASDSAAEASKIAATQKISEVEQVVREKAINTARAVRKEAVKYSQKIGESFNEEYLKAIKGKTTDYNTARKILFKTVDDAGMLRPGYEHKASDWSSAQNKVYRLYQDYSDISKSKESVNIEDFDKAIRDLTGAFRGKQWGSGEHIITDLRNNASEILSETYKELKPILSKYAPKFKIRNAIYARVKPFDKTGDATKSLDSFAQSLSDASMGKMSRRLNEADTISNIQKELGLGEFDDLFSYGKAYQNEKMSLNMIDELNAKTKMQQQNDVDSFIARQKSNLDQMSANQNKILEAKTSELESQSSLLDSLMQKEKRIGDLVWKTVGGAAAATGFGGMMGIGKATSDVFSE